MLPTDHFKVLLGTLDGAERKLHDSLKNIRPEVGFRNRSLVVYKIVDREVEKLDQITILDFIANDDAGASCEMRSDHFGSTQVVSYTPAQLFAWPVFVHLPLHSKLRWSTVPSRPEGGMLGFDFLIRTASRLHLRERGVIYAETGVSFAREFERA
jgi:hypothetical protein